MKPMRSTDFSQLYQLWINSILFQGACNVGRELVRGFDVLPCRDCGSWNSRLLWLELWFWGMPGFCPKTFFAQVRTIFFDTLNLDLSLFSPCLSTWATAAGLEFFGETLDAEDLMAYLHLSGDSKFGVVFDTISPWMLKYLVQHISNHKVGNSMSADLFNSAPNITVYRWTWYWVACNFLWWNIPWIQSLLFSWDTLSWIHT